VPSAVWTPSALRDLARLRAFLASKNAVAARRAVRALRQGVELLSTHPLVGRPVEEMAPEFREWFIPFGDSAYIVLYRFDGKLTSILAVRHGKESGY
jgi:plasmid stabilization system protein ParE